MNLFRPHPVLLLGLMALAGCQNSQPVAEEPPLVVSVAQLKPGKTIYYEDFTGRTAAISQVDIKARATGYLEKIYFKDGEEVKEDQLLYEIDPRTYAATVEAARGAVAKTKATIKLADANLARAKRLVPQGAMSREDQDRYVAEKDSAEAQLLSDKATLHRAELDLSFCKVYAKFSGLISRTRITEGNLVTADQTTLTTLVSQDPIYAYFDADEHTTLLVQRLLREEITDKGIQEAEAYLRRQRLDKEQVRQAVEIIATPGAESIRFRLHRLLNGKLDTHQWDELHGILEASRKYKSYRDTVVPVYLGTRIDADYPHVGRLDFTDNRFDSTTGTYRLRGVFPNKDRALLPDEAVHIRVPIGEPRTSLLVTDAAVVTDLDRKFLFVLNDKNEVEKRPVVLGGMYNGMRIIQSGVQAGEWIAVSHLQRILAGMTVQRREVPMPRPPAPEDLAPPPPPVVHKK